MRGEQVKKVTLLKKSTTYNDKNEPIDTWAADTQFPDGELYCEWWDQGGRERMEDGQIVVAKDIRMMTRRITTLNERDYRIRQNGDDYDIEMIKDIGRTKQILMLDKKDNA